MNELIGFLIVLFVLLVPLLRKLFVDMKKVQEQEKRRQPIGRKPPYMQKKAHVTERMVNQDFVFHSEIEERKKRSAIEERELKSKVDPQFKDEVTSSAFLSREKTQRVRRKKGLEELLAGREFRQKMVLYSEILSPPKSINDR